MKNIYKLRTDVIIDEYGKEHTVYGIELYSDGDPTPRYTVRDVFYEREKAEYFIFLCNSIGLSPEHIDEAVADAVAAM